MPTPDWIKQAALAKRQRICVICGAHFVVPKNDRPGKTCSAGCLSALRADNSSGRNQRPETVAKRAATLKAIRADPARNEAWKKNAAAGLAKWLAAPANAEALARRSSERMKQRHTDPEFQKRRNERSSRVMKENWQQHHDKFAAMAGERYAESEAAGTGINSAEAKARKALAAKWIMTKAQEALHTETDYNAAYADVQARLRREFPYDGPSEAADYYEYCQMIGRLTANHPELRAIADPFMSAAIPRFAAEWRALRRAETRAV